MADVGHHVDAEVTPDGALVRFGRVGGPKNFPDTGNGIFSRESSGFLFLHFLGRL